MLDLRKRTAEALGGSSFAFSVLSRITAPRIITLAFHNVIPDHVKPRGDTSLHLPISSFLDMVEWLASHFEVVGLDDLLPDGELSGSPPRAAITFDDAYAGAMENALPELISRGLPATVFVVSGARSEQTFWWASFR